MIAVTFLRKEDIAKAEQKLLEVHKNFKTSGEQEVIVDFANCLKKRLKQGTVRDFVESCSKAADDLRNEKIVPEAYDKATVGFARNDATPFIAEKLFGKKFAEEVKQCMLSGV
ncbi:MAG: hypothetical protein L6Q29_00430 [Candidatus Pacebacteria bacterium]|nr:hypothetical protein [Candidatus Paceibacterota bacterium]